LPSNRQCRVQADCFVLCLGSQSRTFAESLWVLRANLSRQRLQHNVEGGTRWSALEHSITDFERKLVFAPLAVDKQPVVRVAGIADFETDDTESIHRALLSFKEQPRGSGYVSNRRVQPWCGLRPTTPIAGRSSGGHRSAGYHQSGHGCSDGRSLWQCAADGGFDRSQTAGIEAGALPCAIRARMGGSDVQDTNPFPVVTNRGTGLSQRSASPVGHCRWTANDCHARGQGLIAAELAVAG